MSVPSTDFQTTYTTDGVTTQFDFSWRVVELASVQVYLNGVLQSPGLYNVTKNIVGLGGYVTFLVAPVTAQTLLIQRVSDTLQDNSLENQASLPPATLIDMYDKLTIICQQLTAQIGLSLALSLPSATLGVSGTLPTPIVPGALIGWDAAGTAPYYCVPHTAGWVITDNGPGQQFTSQPSSGGGGGGNMAGSTPPSVVGAVATYADTSARVLTTGAVPVTAGFFLGDNGVGVQPTFQAVHNSIQHTSETVTVGPTVLTGTYQTVMTPSPAQAGTYLVLCQSNLDLTNGGVKTIVDTQIITGGTGGVTILNPIVGRVENDSASTGDESIADYIMLGVAILATNASTLIVQAQYNSSGFATYKYGKCVLVRIA